MNGCQLKRRTDASRDRSSVPTHKAGNTVRQETYCNFNLIDVLGVLEVNVALDAVAPSVHWQSCGVTSVKYDIEAPSCTYMPWCLRGMADLSF